MTDSRTRVSRPALIDWWRVVADLSRAGCSHEDIAKFCGRSKGWVDKIKNTPGTTPRLDDGILLVALWSMHMGRPAIDVPTARSRT